MNATSSSTTKAAAPADDLSRQIEAPRADLMKLAATISEDVSTIDKTGRQIGQSGRDAHPSNLGTAPSVPAARDEIFAQLRPLRAYAILIVGDPAQSDVLVEKALHTAWAEFPSTGSQPSLRTRLFTLIREACHDQLSQTPRRNGVGQPSHVARTQPANPG